MATETSVKLGEHTYECYPQRIGYLRNRLERAVASLAEDGLDNVDSLSGFVQSGGEQVYRFLQVFYPKLMPEHEFHGYGSASAMAEGTYDETGDRSPSLDQIIEAFQLALQVNRLDAMKGFRDALPFDSLMKFIRAAINLRLAELSEDLASRGLRSPTG